MKSLLQFAAVLLALFFVLVASIVCKECATNGFETFVGWVGMVESIVAIAYSCWYYQKHYDVNGNRRD